jgi:hypothetical protein
VYGQLYFVLFHLEYLLVPCCLDVPFPSHNSLEDVERARVILQSLPSLSHFVDLYFVLPNL